MSYGYAELPNITPAQLLQRITQQEIFELVLGKPFSFNERYLSPLRPDKRPACRFEQLEDGTILFVDFGDIVTHRTCFTMVMEKERLSVIGALSYLIQYFNLSGDAADYKEVIRVHYRSTEDKSSFILPFVSKDYDRRDRLYWSQFLIYTDELLEDKVYSVRRFRTKKGRTVTPFGPCYAIDFGHSVKIYQPYSEEYKFYTNCTSDDVGNFNNLPAQGSLLIITKSYKDHRVLRNLGLGLNVIWLLNEGCVPHNTILRNLVNRFLEIVILFDNDFKGVASAMKLCNTLNEMREDCTRMVHLPLLIGSRERSWKDPAEFINKEGRVDLINTIKSMLNGK